MTAIIQQTYPSWQKSLANLITDPAELFKRLDLNEEYLLAANKASMLFPLRVPHSFVSRMKPGDINDPLLKQVLPLALEFEEFENFSKDPLAEQQFNPLPGLLHKYNNRVLLTISSACSINCRYCFRRHFAYEENNPGTKGWDKVIDYIAADKSIAEVIYSGGDPLIAKDNFLANLTHKLAQIPHLKRIRIHTRLPIMIPERICDEFLAWFTQSRLQPLLIIHCNHPNEIDSQVISSLKTLQQRNVTLLNQTVLLKGINDNYKILKTLNEKLFAAGVLPYYLHLLDRTQGTAHFDVDELIAKKIYQQLQANLSGYLVPKLVREIPGGFAKEYILM